jgi:glycosyltransferase involved in cell wall biosynthesis
MAIRSALMSVPALRASGFADYAAWSLFDNWIARELRRLMPRCVVGYEMCCTRTFSTAKEMGLPRILDAAAMHFEAQNRVLQIPSSRRQRKWIARLNDRKRSEIESASAIVCVSRMAKQSYLEAGVPERALFVNPLGCDTDVFRPLRNSGRTSAGWANFAFVGTASFHKGFDLLLNAIRNAARAGALIRLNVIGDPRPLSAYDFSKINVVSHGKLAPRLICGVLAGMDALILPSRLESFGMVVLEALACGVPAIVSDGAGASELIRTGINGWVVRQGSVDALTSAIESCCENVDVLWKMSDICRKTAIENSWDAYGDRALRQFSTVVGAAEAGAFQ